MAGAVSTVTKIVVGKSPPLHGQRAHDVQAVCVPHRNYASFPSAHIVAFHFSVLAKRIKKTWVSIGLYGLAAGCGISRMYTNEHWISDVVLGRHLCLGKPFTRQVV